MLSKTLEMGVCFHRGPACGEHGGTPLSYGLQEKRKFLYLEKFYEEFEIYVKQKTL